MKLYVVILLAIAGVGPSNGLDSLTRVALREGLAVQGITEPELGFHKQWAVDSFFRLSVVDRLLDNPLEVATYIAAAAERGERSQKAMVGLLAYQWRETDVKVTSKDSARIRQEIMKGMSKRRAGTEALPSEVAEAVNVALAGFVVADRYLKQAKAGLSPVELDRLIGEAPGFWQDDEDKEKSRVGALHREFGLSYDTGQGVRAETVLAYARKVDRKALALSGLAVTMAASEAHRLLETRPSLFPHEVGLMEVEGILGGVHFAAESEWGLVVIGAEGDNIYRRDCCLLIELGGDDAYFNRAGGAVGVISNPFSVVIDLTGNDRYECERMSAEDDRRFAFSQGAALFGCGVLVDAAGDDMYRAGHYAQGAGIFGTGLLLDLGGRDIYDAGLCAQGAGHFGVGLIADTEGNDSYSSEGYCQGFGSTRGFGLCADYAGNDVYYAGGKYKHEPLLPYEYRSFAQGFAIGWRPDAAGGIGFLYDRSGNDFYNAEVYAQGTSYWYSLGMLWDGSGYDHYVAAQYSQGAGIHLAVGCLVDNEGNDSYYSRLGPSQGEGHDLSVGVLVDRKGNDVYHASGGAGVALTNSVGLFVDVTGNDVYSSTEPLAFAGGRPARGFASIGSFVDLAGKDYYTAGSAGSDGGRWTNGTYGSGADRCTIPVAGDEKDEGDTLELTGVDTLLLSIDSLFKIAATWEVGNARARVRQARTQLHALGKRAMDYVFDKKTDTKQGLELNAIEKLVKEHPDTAKPYLFRALRDERLLARNNAAYWLGKLGEDGQDGTDSLLLALKEGRVSPRRAANAFGDIGDSLVVPHILYLLKDSYEPSRIVTAEACGKLKHSAAIRPLIQTLGDRLFTVRSAAEMALAAMGESALDSLIVGLEAIKKPALGHAVRACAAIAAGLDSSRAESQERTRRALGPYLGHESAFVRLTVVEGLSRLLDDETRRALGRAKESERNDFVLAAYRRVQAGN